MTGHRALSKNSAPLLTLIGRQLRSNCVNGAIFFGLEGGLRLLLPLTIGRMMMVRQEEEIKGVIYQ